MSPRPPRKKTGPSLWPREHGAYAQLAFPLLTALAVTKPTLGAISFAISTVSGFLAHEPLLVLLGRRGEWRKREQSADASRRLALLCAVGAMAAIGGLAVADRRTVLAFAAVVGLVAVAGTLIWSKREKTLAGELLVATTFSLAAVPVALASGVRWPVATLIAVVWTSTFFLATFTVHAVLRRARTGSTTIAWITGCIAVAVAVCAVALLISGSTWAAALLPPAISAGVVVALGVKPRHLRRIGWSLVATDVLVLAALVLGLWATEHLVVPPF